MKLNKHTKTRYFVVLIGFFFILFSGCDKYKRYEVLTFFFTGVPHPDEQTEVSETADPVSVKAKVDTRERKMTTYIHGPYAAKQCYLCHQTTITKTTSAKKPDLTTQKRFDADLPGRLLSPLKELCAECHPSKSMKSAFNRDLWIHGPVSDGLCIVCHSPHFSQNPYMLLQGTPGKICSTCHVEGFITPIKEHLSGQDCIECHNAHLGKNRFLLKKDFEETF